MTNHTTVERIARQLCEQRGLDFDAKGRHRAHWLAKARRLVERERGIATADALMGIFGFRRVHGTDR